jgi:hypothetical protein
MKMPKREQYYRTQKAAVYEDRESVCPNHTAYEHASWKRKNRVKQLKRTIERLNNESIANYFHGYNAGLQHGIEIGFLQGSKKLSEDILFQRKENQQ